MKIKALDELIQESERIVCISGGKMTSDCGYPAYWEQEFCYELEQKYGCSFEDIFHIGYFETRKEQFYTFYKEEILKDRHKPSAAFFKLAELEKEGRLSSIITKSRYNLAQRAGCKNVIDIYGNISTNVCPKCGQKYSSEYILQSKSVPVCLECATPIRPAIKMYGELVDNSKVSRAMEEIAAADMLLILDTGYEDEFKDYITRYKGNKAVLIKEKKEESDRKANYIIYDKSKNVLARLMDKTVHIMFDELGVVNK